MNDNQIKELIMFILGQADYDLMKSFDPETAEEPDYAIEEMNRLVASTKKFLKKMK